MKISLEPNEQSFITAFITCSLDSSLKFPESRPYNKHYFITNIQLIETQQASQTATSQLIPLDQYYSLILYRNSQQYPIVDVANFEQVPDGWQMIKTKNEIYPKMKSFLCFKRGLISQYNQGLHTIQIIDNFKQQIIQQSTQPSLSYKSQLIHSYLKLQIQQTTTYLNFCKKSQIQVTNLRFLPTTQSLYSTQKYKLDIPSLAILCFPQGIRIFTKQSGFKFFTFILTTDNASRYYCNSIIFTQKLQTSITNQFYHKFGIKNQRGIYSQKVFTLISLYNCTDQTNICLQYLYRIYLSKSYNIFQQKINNLPFTFKIDLQTNKSKFSVQDFDLCFKINSSYPQTSTQAIYAIFKFLQIQNIVTVVENLLLQRKIFFISDCENIIGMSIQAFLSFIYPMNWIHGIINPLSSSMIQYTQAPMTITFGLSNQLVNKIKPDVDGLFVYLDHNRVQLKNNPNIQIIGSLRLQLIQRLNQFYVYDQFDVKDYLNNPQNLSLFKTQKTQDPHFDPYKIRNLFFQLTVFMLRNYNDYFIINPKKHPNSDTQKIIGIKKCYDLNGLMHTYRKDPFMHTFIQTSLFSVLIQKKLQQPKNKWIKTLDKAIKKIQSYNKYYIQQQSDNDNCSDNQAQPVQVVIPKGCFGLINFNNKDYSDQNNSKSSSRKSVSRQQKQFQKNQDLLVKNLINAGRMSLPNQYEKTKFGWRGSQINNAQQQSMNQQKSPKSAPKQIENGQKNQHPQTSYPQNNDQLFPPQPPQKSTILNPIHLCTIFSYPYKILANSIVSRWTKKQYNKFIQWKNNTQLFTDQLHQNHQLYQHQQQLKCK